MDRIWEVQCRGRRSAGFASQAVKEKRQKAVQILRNMLPAKEVETSSKRHGPCQLWGRDPNQPQKDSERVNGQLSHRTEKSFPLFSSSSLPLLYRLGEDVCPGSDLEELGPAGDPSPPLTPLPGGSGRVVGATAKVMGASEQRNNPTPPSWPHAAIASKAVQK